MSTTTERWKLAKGRTWRQKLEEDHPNHGKIVSIPPHMQKRFGKGKMMIPRPRDVDTLMRKPKKGQVITVGRLSQRLAEDGDVDAVCPLTTGIFLRIVAEAAEEDLRAGKKRVTPYWRTIKDDGKLNQKFPGGAKAQAAKLRQEGLRIRPARGKQPPTVVDFADYLAKL